MLKLRLFLCLGILSIFACQPESSKLPQENKFLQLSESEQRLPENALSAMKTIDGLRVQLFASEPMLINPTNMAIDHKGRVWVCEVNNYRLSKNISIPKREEGDRILILEDTNGDGKADKQKVFYQGKDLNNMLGIAVLGKRVVVSASPLVLEFTDENGDDVPERKDTIFTGVGGEDSDHAIHAFSFGMDGRFYFNFGNNGNQLLDKNGKPVKDKWGNEIINNGKPHRQGMVFRCEPDFTNLEVVGHNFRNNYEVAIDAFGSMWQSDNDDDGNEGTRINFVMEYGNYGYQDQVTGASWQTRRVGLEKEIPQRHWHLNDPGVVPNLIQTGAGSPTGILVYEGDLLPEKFQGQMIHAEALQNVIRAYPVQKDGAGYKGEIVEVLKSQDQWFRPSDVCVAPDGSVLVADWYDAGVGGHFMKDAQRGRIYRLAPQTNTYKMLKFDLNTAEGSVEALQNPNQDIQYQAWMKLREMGTKAESALNKLWQSKNPRHRARALWILAQIPGKGKKYVETALEDKNEDIQIMALRIIRRWDEKNLLNYISQIKNSPNWGLKREAALALRHQGTPQAAELWADLALQHTGKDRWYLEALGIGADLHADLYFKAWKEKIGKNWKTTAARDIVWRIHTQESIPMLVDLIADPKIGKEDLTRYFRAFHFKSAPDKDEQLARLLEIKHPQLRDIRVYTLGALGAEYVKGNAAIRSQLTEILPSIQGTAEWLSIVQNLELKDQQKALLAMFLKSENVDLQQEAAVTLVRFGGQDLLRNHYQSLDETAKIEFTARLGRVNNKAVVQILGQWAEDAQGSEALRRHLVECMGKTWDGQHYLQTLLEEKKLRGEIQTLAAIQMLNCWDDPVRQAGSDFLSKSGSQNGKPLPPIEQLVNREGNIVAGKAVFEKYCQTCHRVNQKGTEFGPDLSQIGKKLPKSALYAAIMFPSAGINFGFEGYAINLKNNSTLRGYILSETETTLTLKMMGGASKEIQKTEIASKETLDKSLMTEGLAPIIGEKDLINLVEYLASLKDKEVITMK
ncbi:MAG: c-type cytochrome [Microscillaceae bacterium]|nr:c-type cytochrome [Microscillaceae bacterium]